MGKKRRDGRAAKRGNNSSSSAAEFILENYDPGAVYEGEVKDGKPHGRGKLKLKNREVYDGEWKEGWYHGRGTMKWEDGDVYVGEWKDDLKHGKGTYRWADGRVYTGAYLDGEKHGRGTYRWADGDVYEGEWMRGMEHGKGTKTSPSGECCEGDWKEGKQHGRGRVTYESGDVYVGEFENDERHGTGTLRWANGEVYDGQWAGGNQHGKGTLKLPTGEVICEGIWTDGKCTPNADTVYTTRSSLPNADSGTDDAAPEAVAGRGLLDGRKLRSQRSQKNRLETVKQTCEHCGVDDGQFKLRVCSGCNLALYCSASCQKAATRSHRRICDISSQLPSRGSDRLALNYDKELMVDLDAGLRYGTKYMDSLKHLKIDLEEMSKDDTVKLSTKQLSSLLKSKKGALESVFWVPSGHIDIPGVTQNGHAVWKELHGLKQLWLYNMKFDDAQCLHDIIYQQKDTLEVLSLPYLKLEWSKAKSRRTTAQAVSACEHLIKLRLPGCVLMDSDLKVMLQYLPNLRNLNLVRDTDNNHEFTDNTCSLIARKCPGLQELSLSRHDQLSVRGIRKIFEGCPHLRSFYTSTRKLSCKDIRSLLDSAPRLLYLYLGDQTGGVICPECPGLLELGVATAEVSEIIEATGGRTVLELLWNLLDFEPEGLSAKTGEKYVCQQDVLKDIRRRSCDQEVANEWEILLEG